MVLGTLNIYDQEKGQLGKGRRKGRKGQDPLEHVKVGSDIQYRVSITIAVTTHILCTESYVCLLVGRHRERP